MSQFFISCKESRIENNRSFYGCFYLGPFEPSQSITIANTLRRTLLSEIYGVAIVSVEIEGAAHEYSSLPGVRESVLDILLNLKEIVLKKTIKTITPQIGYLRAHGPGVVTAANLRLPPFIQCVDPSQYIANLSHNGFLNMKFIIQYGNKWISSSLLGASAVNLNPNYETKIDNGVLTDQSVQNERIDYQSINTTVGVNIPSSGGLQSNLDNTNNLGKNSTSFFEPNSLGSVIMQSNTRHPFFLRSHPSSLKIKGGKEKEKGVNNLTYNENSIAPKLRIPVSTNLFNFHFKKRRLFLRKLKEFGLTGSNLYINMFLKNLKTLFKYKKKRDFRFKEKTKEKLSLILKLNHQFPAINFKIGPQRKGISRLKKRNKIDPKKPVSLLRTGLATEEGQEGGSCFQHLKSSNSLSPKNQKNFNFKRLKNSLLKYHSKLSPKKTFFNVNPINIDAIFNPVTKVNYIIETNDYQVTQMKIKSSFKISELYETLLNLKVTNLGSSEIQRRLLGGKDGRVSMGKDVRGTGPRLKNCIQDESFSDKLTHDYDNLLDLNQQMSLLNKETLKHNIILEIWTNGSIHPQDCLAQAFKNLIKIFTQLKKIQPLGFNSISLKSDLSLFQETDPMIATVPMQSLGYEATPFFEEKEKGGKNEVPSYEPIQEHKINISTFNRILVKNLKMAPLKSTFLNDLLPINETNFLSTYINPKIKDYYLNKQNLSIILNTSIIKNYMPPIFIFGKTIPDISTRG